MITPKLYRWRTNPLVLSTVCLSMEKIPFDVCLLSMKLYVCIFILSGYDVDMII